MPCPVQQVLHVLGGALEYRLDPAVVQVAHPPRHAALPGHPLAGGAKVDALDLAGDQHPITDHVPTLSLPPAHLGPLRSQRQPRHAYSIDSCHGGQVTDFKSEDLTGSVFEDVSLTRARFRLVDLAGADFREVDLTGARIRGALLVDMDLSGAISNLRVNGVDVVPLVETELDRRYPGRSKMRPADADGFREAWDILERLWQQTVERARGVAPELLHERVDEEWSFIETLRHLVFATDAWVRRAILGDPSPWDPLDLPHEEMPDEPSIPRDREARPSLDQVLALRADRMATVRRVLADLTDATLAGRTVPVTEPGYPEPESFPVRRCLQAILIEEWEHRLYAERDFDLLQAR
jgi:uncharacterized protein YjbI with pentapeptide repeats